MTINWISVEDEPSIPDVVPLFLQNQDHSKMPIIGYYSSEKKCFFEGKPSNFYSSFPIIVTHWSKIPEDK